MADDTFTHERLIWKLIENIARAEGKELYKADRDYTLDLVRDVVKAIDGTRTTSTKIREGAA